MNLTVPHDLIDAGARNDDLDAALLPILQHLDPDKEEDLAGLAGSLFSTIVWSELNEEARGYKLMRFSEFVINTYRTR